MRSWMRRMGVIVTSFIMLIVVGGLVLPTEYRVERSVEIAAEPQRIHAYVGDLTKWDLWSPWKEMDPSIQTTYGAKTSGVGASQSWTDKEGGGSLIVTMSSPSQGIEYDLLFDQGTYECRAAMRYDPEPDGATRVFWIMEGDMNLPILGAYLALTMDAMVGRMFDRGLAKLKTYVEKDSHHIS